MAHADTPADAEHVDAVVVGSGFGGSVAAFRLAEADASVIVLERGKAYPPGSFPRSPHEMKTNFWDPSEGLHGLFNVWSFHGFDSVVSSGLGGGSLIYANVLLRKDERWFVHRDPLPNGGYETWPITRADLDPHYDAVERMLGATPYPLDEPGFRDTPKTQATREAAQRLDLDWQLPPLAVSFAPEPGARPGIGVPLTDPSYGNLHGVSRRTCRLCGECDIGCNDGSKNTLDHTYLSAAAHHGADIRTRSEVRRIRPRRQGGFEVSYVRHDPEREGQPTDTRSLAHHVVTCDRLMLGAGTYGTTYLLLRNRAAFPRLSSALGTRFSGNGDFLTFLLPDLRRRGPRGFDPSHGPVITSAIRYPDTVDGDVDDAAPGRGFYVEEGGYPGFVQWLATYADVGHTAARMVALASRWLVGRLTRSGDSNLGGELSHALVDGRVSSGSMPLLGMGRDIADGVMRLDDDTHRRLVVDWDSHTSKAYFARVREAMQAMAETLGADYVDNPAWLFRRIVTVHPLGGAPMAHTPVDGVCDAQGEVFGYPGLHVVDGAAMPGPVGPNPSLTIAAFADRVCDRVLQRSADAPAASADATA